MKKRLGILATIFIFGLSLSVIPTPADAQILNKITKGLGKVSKGLEKISNQVDQVTNKGNENKSSTTAPVPSSQTENQDYTEYDETEANLENDEQEVAEIPEFLKGVRQPTITPKTLLIKKKECFHDNTLNPVSDGVFALQETNPEYGYSYYYGFWTIDGKRLTEARYQSPEGYPVFDSGAVVVKDLPDSKNYQPFIILYKDGTALKLPENYTFVSEFRDGVATAETKGTVQKKSERFCMDTKGNPIWRHLDSPTRAVMEVGYLRDGLRRVLMRFEAKPFRYNTAYGFINDRGEWVIDPDLQLAREFKNGYCAVKDKEGKLKFIDTKGNTVLQLPDNWGINEFGDISDGYFVRQTTIGAECTYYDLEGNPKRTYREASDFHKGFAFIVNDYEEPLCVINTKFEIVKVIGRIDSNKAWAGINTPIFGNADLGTVGECVVLTSDGEPTIFISHKFWQSYAGDFWQSHIGNFLPGDYAPATIIFGDNYSDESFGWSGFIDKNGDFAVIITDNENALRKLPGEVTDGEYRVSIPQFDMTPIGPKFLNK